MKLPCWQDLVKWQILFSLTEFPNWPKRLLKGCAWAILITFGGISLVDSNTNCRIFMLKKCYQSHLEFLFLSIVYSYEFKTIHHSSPFKCDSAFAFQEIQLELAKDKDHDSTSMVLEWSLSMGTSMFFEGGWTGSLQRRFYSLHHFLWRLCTKNRMTTEFDWFISKTCIETWNSPCLANWTSFNCVTVSW